MTKKYLDSNVFIYPILYSDEKAEICKRILKKVASREFNACTSVLCWDEFVYTLRKTRGKEISEEEGERFLRFPNLIFIDANKLVVFKAQELVKKYNLKPRDAIHSATAMINDVDEIISDDSDFDVINELKRIKLE